MWASTASSFADSSANDAAVAAHLLAGALVDDPQRARKGRAHVAQLDRQRPA